MKTVTVIAPAAWATYLLYGEEGDWDHDDEKACKAMAAEYGSPNVPPVDVKEIGFCWNPDYGEPGDCCEYTFSVLSTDE